MLVSLRRIGIALAVLALAGVACGLAVADAAPRAWWSEVLQHPRPQYAVAGLAGTITLLALVRRRAVLIALVVPVWAGAGMVWSTPGGRTSDALAGGLRVLSANVLSDNPDPESAVAALLAEDADVVAVLEATPAWTQSLQRLRAAYPSHRELLREDNFGIAVYARRGRIATWWPDGVGVPGLVVAIDGLEILAVHPPPPFSPAYHANWRIELAAIADWAVQRPSCAVVGDLNATPWCAAFRELCVAGALAGPGIPAAWSPTWQRGTPLAAPIDHVLVGPGVRIAGFSVGGAIGSDHRPVSARLLPAP